MRPGTRSRVQNRCKYLAVAGVLFWGALPFRPVSAQPGPAVNPAPVAETSGARPWLPVESWTLENGIEVQFVHRPFAKLVSAGWVVKAGAADDPSGRTGLAHLVEHLLFQGTESIGTKDWSRERELMVLEERLLRDSSVSPEALAGVRRNLARVQQPGELAKLWADGGFMGTGALTTKDFSFYTATFPRQRLEAWFWLERDRIRSPAMRGVQREQRVVREEERQRSGSGGRAQVEIEFDKIFWGPSPYHRPTDGYPGEMESAKRGDALEFHSSHYSPSNLVLAVVGDVELSEVRRLTRLYLGSLTASPAADSEASGVVFDAAPTRKLFRASCECRPSVRVRFPSVAYGHADAVALDVLAAILNGRSGRLYTGVVSTEPAAFAAYATHKALARSGSFSLVAEAVSDDASPEELTQLRIAVSNEFEGLKLPAADGGLNETDVERARSILRAEAAREVKDSDALRTRLLIDAGLGDSRRLAEWKQRLDAVTVVRLRSLLETLFEAERGVTFLLGGQSQATGGRS